MAAAVEPPDEAEHGAELAEGEGGDEGERVHAAEVGLAVGDVHGAPQGAGGEGGDDAAQRVSTAGGGAVNRGEAEQDGSGDDGDGAEHDAQGGARSRALELAEEQAAPEQAEERVRVPQGKGDGEPDIADGEDGERVGDRPERAGQQCPDYQVLLAAEVAEDVGGALEQRGKRPARGEDAGHHPERDGEGGEAEGDELGGRLGRAQPHAGRQPAGDAEPVQGAGTPLEAGGGGRQQWRR
jgi:hypothetical protein